MTNQDKHRLDEFARRIDAARGQEQTNRPGTTLPLERGAFGAAFRIGLELVSAVAVCTAIGWFLDQWLGTLPLFLILFFLLGAGVGFRTVIKTAMTLNDNGTTDGRKDDSQS